MQNLRKISDITRAELHDILAKAAVFKEKHDLGIRREDYLSGKVVAMVFEKPSLRTKVAFEVAATYLGGTPVFLSSGQILASGNMEKGAESLPDIGRNLERFADLIVARVYRHETIDELSKSVSIPVINALCDRHHPTQALADINIIRKIKGSKSEIKVAFIGDGNNVAVSLMQVCALDGIDCSVASPEGFEVPIEDQELGRSFAKASGSQLEFITDPTAAIAAADVVYTDTFVSMGQESEKEARKTAFAAYQVNMELLRKAKPDAVFMHCLPAHRGEEVTDEVMDCPQSVVFDQAESRLHIAKALISVLL